MEAVSDRPQAETCARLDAFGERVAPAPDHPATAIDQLLAEQQELTAVEQFSRSHDALSCETVARYSRLLPVRPPREGEQYSFDVDLDCCSGCKACVTACHTLNGLAENETWRDVGVLVGGTETAPVLQHVTTACHHCVEPACMSACPVDAYEKDALTGIVRHLDDQCFGCQYCTLACPYDVPRYNSERGIVRKCDMCADRLSEGEAPACVQACPHQAIAIRVVEIDEVLADSETDLFLPGAPEPNVTLPTTRYRTNRVFPRNTLPVDYHSVNPQHPHWPLIVMLVLTQLSVGAFSVALSLEFWLQPDRLASFRPIHAATALGFGLLAISASVLHLGRPRYAFRAIIGLRHSWLSREILMFGVFAGLAAAYSLLCRVPGASAGSLPVAVSALGWSVGGAGLVALFCSVMIYVFTRRDFWSFGGTSLRFLGTALLLGIAATWLSLLLPGALEQGSQTRLMRDAGPALCLGLMCVSASKLLLEATLFRHLTARRSTSLKRTAQLMTGPLSAATLARFACGVLGGIIMPAFLLGPSRDPDAAGVLLTLVVAMLFVACLVGELLERYLFFAAVATPRMPGGLRP